MAPPSPPPSVLVRHEVGVEMGQDKSSECSPIPATVCKPVRAARARTAPKAAKKPPQIDRDAERHWLLGRTKRALNELLSKTTMTAAEHQAFANHVDKIAKLTGAYAPTVATINTPDMASTQANARALLSELFVENGALMVVASDKLNADSDDEGSETTTPDDPSRH
jgi:hypothetical protein